MLLVWGFRVKAKVLARLLLVCHLCQKPAAQTVVQRVRWFTLFWLPLIPGPKKYKMQCALCGQISDLSQEDAERLVLSAQEQASETTPVDSGPSELPA